MTDAAPAQAKPTEPWRQRLIRGLLYGRNVDRARDVCHSGRVTHRRTR